MIVRASEIYTVTALRHGLDQELVSSVGETVFKSLMEKMVVPHDLAYELDHVGTFAIRHKKFLGKHATLLSNNPDHPFVSTWRHVIDMVQDFRNTKAQFQSRRAEYDRAKKQG